MKKILCFLVVVLFLSVSLGMAQAYVLKVKVQAANVRSEPDRNAAVVKTLQLGAIVESNNKIGEWFEIIVDDGRGNRVSGYISLSVVDIVSAGAQPAQPPVQQPVQPPVQPPVQQPAQPPVNVYVQPATYAAPKTYSGGGFRIFGGLASTNITYPKDRADQAAQGIAYEQFIKSRSGFLAGVGFESGSQFSFEIDAIYMPKGVKFQGSYDATAQGAGKIDFDIDAGMNAITVPLLLKLKILPGTTPYIFGGGEVGYILDGKVKYSITQDGQNQSGEEDMLQKDANGETTLNRIDYGVVFGGGFELALGGMRLTVEARYHMGLANLNKETAASKEAGVTGTDYIRTKALVVIAGIKL